METSAASAPVTATFYDSLVPDDSFGEGRRTSISDTWAAAVVPPLKRILGLVASSALAALFHRRRVRSSESLATAYLPAYC